MNHAATCTMLTLLATACSSPAPSPFDPADLSSLGRDVGREMSAGADATPQGMPPDFIDAPSRARTFPGLERDLPNPERGFYSYVEVTENTDFSYVQERGHTLVYSYVRLDAWRSGPLPEELFERMDRGLDALRAQGLKIVLRFA